jgi:hypothetical protein
MVLFLYDSGRVTRREKKLAERSADAAGKGRGCGARVVVIR